MVCKIIQKSKEKTHLGRAFRTIQRMGWLRGGMLLASCNFSIWQVFYCDSRYKLQIFNAVYTGFCSISCYSGSTSVNIATSTETRNDEKQNSKLHSFFSFPSSLHAEQGKLIEGVAHNDFPVNHELDSDILLLLLLLLLFVKNIVLFLYFSIYWTHERK